MREFFKNKTKITLIAVSLAFVLLFSSLAYLSDGFRNWNTKEWFNKSGSAKAVPEEDNALVYDSDGNIMESGKVYPLSSSMIFSGAAPLAETSGVLLKAVMIPEYATNPAVDWSVSWLNPSSAFASGKTASGYIKVTPVSDGSLIATAVCLQAFGEKIQIVVTSKDNPNVKASCIADYVQRVTNVKGEFTGTGLGDNSFTFASNIIPRIEFMLDHNWYYYLREFLLDSGYTEEELDSGDWSGFDYTNFILSDLGKVVPGCNIKSPKYTLESPPYTLADTFEVEVYLYPSDGYREYCENLGYYPDYVGAGVNVTKWFFPEEYTAFWLFRYGIPSNLYQLRTLLYECQNLSIPQLQFDVIVTGTYSSFTKSYPARMNVDALSYSVKGLRVETDGISY